MMKEDKIMFNKFETKSNNLKILGEEFVNQIHLITGQVDQTHNSINLIKSLLFTKNMDHTGKVLSSYISINFYGTSQ